MKYLTIKENEQPHETMKGVSPLKPKYIVFSDKERATATHV
jgi:hypothetical protein